MALTPHELELLEDGPRPPPGHDLFSLCSDSRGVTCTPVCAYCGAEHSRAKDGAAAPKPLKACSVCRPFLYCEVAHQKADWKRHRVACNMVNFVVDIAMCTLVQRLDLFVLDDGHRVIGRTKRCPMIRFRVENGAKTFELAVDNYAIGPKGDLVRSLHLSLSRGSGTMFEFAPPERVPDPVMVDLYSSPDELHCATPEFRAETGPVKTALAVILGADPPEISKVLDCTTLHAATRPFRNQWACFPRTTQREVSSKVKHCHESGSKGVQLSRDIDVAPLLDVDPDLYAQLPVVIPRREA